MRQLDWHWRSFVGALVVAGFAGSATFDAQSIGMAFEGNGNRVLVFDADADVPIGTVEIPGLASSCGDCVITPDLTLGFVSNFTTQIYVIDLTSTPPSLAGSVLVSTQAEDLAITPDGSFVLATDGTNPHPICVVDVATLTEVDTFDSGVAPNSVEVGNDGSVLFTTTTGRVRRLTLDENGVLTDTGESMLVPAPNNVVFSRDGNTGVVITRSDGDLRSFSVPGLAQLDSVPLPGASAFGTSVAFHPSGERLFARNTMVQTITAFDYVPETGAFGAQGFSIPAGFILNCFGTEQLSVHPDGSKLYVTNNLSLSVYDTETGAFITTVADIDLGHGIYVQTLAECFLVVGGGIGDDTFGAGGHLWSTQIEGITDTYPVTLTNYPSFELPRQRFLHAKRRSTSDSPSKKGLRRAVVPEAELAVQVVMWNPNVFPTNPEQFTQPLQVTLWSDGSVTSRSPGIRDGMQIRMETYSAGGRRYVRFPFSIDGF